MPRQALAIALVALLVLAARGRAAEEVRTALAVVEKASKDSLTVLPRAAGGRFGKSLTLRITGTSKLSTVTTRKMGKKTVPVQRDADPGDFRPKQAIAIIYISTSKTDHVLLAAVGQPDAK